jgi:hypothetical protein
MSSKKSGNICPDSHLSLHVLQITFFKGRLFGMLAGTGLSTENYCLQKQRDKELE